MEYFKMNEENILNNNRIKVYLVDTDIDIYNDIERAIKLALENI